MWTVALASWQWATRREGRHAVKTAGAVTTEGRQGQQPAS